MNNLLKLIALGVSVTLYNSCGHTEIDGRLKAIHSELLMLYVSACHIPPPVHSVIIANNISSDKDIMGLCVRGTFENVILINERMYNNSRKAYITTILAHEMGHCLLKLQHKEERTSYMHKGPAELDISAVYNEFLSDASMNCGR